MFDPEKDAANLLDRVWVPKVGEPAHPVDPIYIAQELGVDVYLANLTEDTAGMLVKRTGRAPEIYLNNRDHPNRQRFTCAHEVGHYIKRTDGKDDQAWEFVDLRDHVSGRGTDKGEVYANQFAAALLMPASEVRKLRQEMDAPELAIEFKVSLEAMKHRLVNLRIS